MAGKFSNELVRAVPEFSSDSGWNPAFFTNPADIRLRPKLGRIWNFAGFGKLSLNNTNLNDLYMQNLFPTTYNCTSSTAIKLVK